MIIRQAVLADIDGVLSLLKANHKDQVADRRDGFVTTNMSKEQMAALITEENGVTVAEEDGKIIAFALAASWQFWSVWPLFAYMIEILPQFQCDGKKLSVENSYQYGPVCVEKSYRGTGVFEQVFLASLHSMKDRYPIMATFINQVNGRSFAAHTRKAGMKEAGTFHFNGNDYYLMTCLTENAKQ